MRKMSILMAVFAILAVSACGVTKKSLGLAKQGPDETLVKKNEPLILPPEYNVRPKKSENNEGSEVEE